MDVTNNWINGDFITYCSGNPKFQRENSSISEILSKHFKERKKNQPPWGPVDQFTGDTDILGARFWLMLVNDPQGGSV